MIKIAAIVATIISCAMLLILFFKSTDIYGLGILVSHDTIQSLLLLVIATHLTTKP